MFVSIVRDCTMSNEHGFDIMSKRMIDDGIVTIERQTELLQALAEQIYADKSLDLCGAVDTIQENDIRVDLNDLIFLEEFTKRWRYGRWISSFCDVDFERFIQLLIESKKSPNVLIRHCIDIFPLLGTILGQNPTIERVDIIPELGSEYSKEEFKILISSYSQNKLHYLSDDRTNIMKNKNRLYNTIVIFGYMVDRLFGANTRNIDANGAISLREKFEPFRLYVADAAHLLSDNGFIVSRFGKDFVNDSNDSSLRRNIHRLGLYISAILAIPNDRYNDLVIFERGDREEIFTGEIPIEKTEQLELINRLWKRENGPTVAQGRIVCEPDFFGFEILQAQHRTKQLVTREKLEEFSFDHVIVDVKEWDREKQEDEPYEEHPDAVYLPEPIRVSATVRQEDLPRSLKKYWQLIVNTEVVLPDYFARLLNTPLGHSIRRSMVTPLGNLLRKSPLYFPPKSDQKRALDSLSKLTQLRNELSELEAEMWNRPSQTAKVFEAIKTVNRVDRFDDWYESLPFPLAAILRAYDAVDKTDKEKYERLLHFFEAIAEFFALIHLSAARSGENEAESDQYWMNTKRSIAMLVNKPGLTLERPTFGLWVNITNMMGSELRKLLNGDEDSRICALSLYKCADLLPLEFLSDKAVGSVLQRTNGYRNRWTGHGGSPTPDEAADRHRALRDELATLRGAIGTRFQYYQLIEPKEGKTLPGPLFRTTARCVMGSNPLLKDVVIETRTPAVSGQLYFYNTGHSDILELLPLVQVRETPQPACYFYNRIEKSESRLVSYQIAPQSEVGGPSELLENLFKEIAAAGRTQ